MSNRTRMVTRILVGAVLSATLMTGCGAESALRNEASSVQDDVGSVVLDESADASALTVTSVSEAEFTSKATHYPYRCQDGSAGDWRLCDALVASSRTPTGITWTAYVAYEGPEDITGLSVSLTRGDGGAARVRQQASGSGGGYYLVSSTDPGFYDTFVLDAGLTRSGGETLRYSAGWEREGGNTFEQIDEDLFVS